MTLRHFRIFLAVCERLSMTEAARQLHISQPSVTQAIHEMENHYGILLFERLGRHIYLTAAGENLKQYAYQILSLCQQAEDSQGEEEEEPVDGLDSAPTRLRAT